MYVSRYPLSGYLLDLLKMSYLEPIRYIFVIPVRYLFILTIDIRHKKVSPFIIPGLVLLDDDTRSEYDIPTVVWVSNYT